MVNHNLPYLFIGTLFFYLFTFLSCSSEEKAFELIEIPANDLIPEGIAYDQQSERFFLSGLHRHKIVQYHQGSDELSDFIPEKYNSYGMGVGMKVNHKDRMLIALSSDVQDSVRFSMIHFYNLDSKTENRQVVVEDTIPFFLNDLDITEEGHLYISDTEGSRIFYCEHNSSTTSAIYQEANMYPNGLALDDDDENLYIASWQKGILRLDLDSMKTQSIHKEGRPISSQGIDGLYFYKNSLIGIQNGYQDKTKHKIIQFHLDNDFLVHHIDTLAMNHSSFDIPTTGVIVKNRFYCLANSQLENLNQETNEIIDTSILNATYIIGIPLK